jgi:hypothetical protein
VFTKVVGHNRERAIQSRGSQASARFYNFSFRKPNHRNSYRGALHAHPGKRGSGNSCVGDASWKRAAVLNCRKLSEKEVHVLHSGSWLEASGFGAGIPIGTFLKSAAGRSTPPATLIEAVLARRKEELCSLKKLLY